jgi:hypothetical protein
MVLFKVIAGLMSGRCTISIIYYISYSRITVELIVAEQGQPQGSNGSSWSYVAFAKRSVSSGASRACHTPLGQRHTRGRPLFLVGKAGLKDYLWWVCLPFTDLLNGSIEGVRHAQYTSTRCYALWDFRGIGMKEGVASRTPEAVGT